MHAGWQETMMIRDAPNHDLGTLVIRVWRERDAENPFRARVIFGDAEQDVSASTPTANPEDVIDAVRRWLHDVAS